MDKIKALMIENGMSEEAATKICESMGNYVTSHKQKLDEQFKQRLAKAKQVCLEQTSEHKRELSRRFQIFVEAKQVQIEESLRKQIASKETEAAATLEKVSRLIEGLDIDGQPNSELKAELQKLTTAYEKVVTERDAAVNKANDSLQICERVMKRCRQLERVVKESQGSNGKPINEGKTQPNRIDGNRQNGKPTTPRPTLKQNQVVSESATRQPAASGTQTFGPAQIAKDMDADLR